MAITPVALTYPLMRDGDTDYLNSSLLSNLKQKANLLQRKLTSSILVTDFVLLGIFLFTLSPALRLVPK